MNWFSKSIANKLIGITIIVTLVIFSVAGLILNNIVGGDLEASVQEGLQKDAQILSGQLDVFFAKNGELVNQMLTNEVLTNYVKETKTRAEKRENPTFGEVVDTLIRIKDTDENIALAWIGITSMDDLVINDYDWDHNADYDIDTRPWYLEMVENGEGLTYTDPYVDAVTGNLIISIVAPIYDGGTIVGNVGIDLLITDVSNMMQSYKIGDEGYPILITKAGTIVYHPDELQILEVNMTEMDGKLGELGKEMVAGAAGIDQYSYQGVDKYFAYSPLTTNGWSVGTMIPIEETKELIDQFNMTSFITYAVAIVIMVLIFFVAIKRTMKRVPLVLEGMRQFASGDLTVHLDVETKDEIGMIARSFNKVTEAIREFMVDILESSSNVSHASEAMVTISTESKQALNEVSSTINEVADGTSDQAAETESSSAEVHLLSDQIEAVLGRTEQVYQRTSEAHELSNQGTKILRELNDQSEKNHESVLTIKKIVEEVDTSSNEITTIVEMINSISEQTNLLALNASIEAARAGEAGRGFAVVADEIRQLAEQTNVATEEIRDKITSIQEKSKTAVLQTESSEQIVEQSGEVVKETEKIFNSILENLSALFDLTEQTKRDGEVMNKKKEQIVGFIENVSASSEEVSASMEEMSANTEEQLAIMTNLEQEAIQLRDLAKHLKENLNHFDL